jgi:hypothetical protein
VPCGNTVQDDDRACLGLRQANDQRLDAHGMGIIVVIRQVAATSLYEVLWCSRHVHAHSMGFIGDRITPG